MKRTILLKSLIGIAIILIPSMAAAHDHPVYRDSLNWPKQSPLAAKYLGDRIENG